MKCITLTWAALRQLPCSVVSLDVAHVNAAQPSAQQPRQSTLRASPMMCVCVCERVRRMRELKKKRFGEITEAGLAQGTGQRAAAQARLPAPYPAAAALEQPRVQRSRRSRRE
jgi:hypothetical protein